METKAPQATIYSWLGPKLWELIRDSIACCNCRYRDECSSESLHPNCPILETEGEDETNNRE